MPLGRKRQGRLSSQVTCIKHETCKQIQSYAEAFISHAFKIPCCFSEVPSFMIKLITPWSIQGRSVIFPFRHALEGGSRAFWGLWENVLLGARKCHFPCFPGRRVINQSMKKRWLFSNCFYRKRVRRLPLRRENSETTLSISTFLCLCMWSIAKEDSLSSLILLRRRVFQSLHATKTAFSSAGWHRIGERCD